MDGKMCRGLLGRRPLFVSRLGGRSLLCLISFPAFTPRRASSGFLSDIAQEVVAEMRQSDYPGRWWTMLPDGRIECGLCPRFENFGVPIRIAKRLTCILLLP